MDNTKEKFAKLEAELEKLLPAPVSDEAYKTWNEEIELRLQEMEAKDVDLTQTGSRRFKLSGVITAAAACLVLGFTLAAALYHDTSSTNPHPTLVEAATERPERSLYEILSSTKVVQSEQEVELVEEKAHRIPMRKVRYRILDTAKLRDSETGVVVTITEPREEVLIEPVESF